MRVAVIVVTIFAVTTPSEASRSCMSKIEARQHFASAHIYWHGPDHCWDATPPRHRQIQVQQKPPVQEARRQSESKWHDAMSAILADDEPAQIQNVPAPLDNERQNDGAVANTWADRWVNMEPSQSPLVARRVRVVQIAPLPVIEHNPEPTISSHDVVVLAFVAFLLTLGTVGVMYRHEP